MLAETKEEANRYKRYYFHHDYDKMIAEAKADDAREIFEELKQKRKELWYLGKYTMFECWCKAEDELKKKYTEEPE